MADTKSLHILHESAAGYTLFSISALEEIGQITSSESISEMSRFSRHVHLEAFQPFTSAEEALANASAVSEHVVTPELNSFLEMNLPMIGGGKKKSKKKSSKGGGDAALGVIDPALATAIAETLTDDVVTVRSDDTIREIVRGIRVHLPHFIKELKDGAMEQAQLGLGHSYSRLKVKFNPARSDNMIIQSIALLDQMDKDLNTFAMRVREWYSWHFPELKEVVKDNYMFARCAAFVQDKASLCPRRRADGGGGEDDDEEDDEEMEGEEDDGSGAEEKLAGLVEIVGDEEMAKAIVAAAKTSMGMDCSAVDMVNIVNFTQRMVKLAEYRKELATYLTDKMKLVAPNLSTLIGDTVAARLISKAGSLTNLAKAPASTVQILGAEKALFRALKTKGNTPKYGLIYHSTFIGRAEKKNKGRISRYLANKCSIASRIDSFSDDPCAAYGEKLREQVEERLKFYETGAQPRKNVDVMEEVAKSLKAGKVDEDGDMDVDTPSKKKKKKDKKRKAEEEEDVEMEEAEKPLSKKEKKAAKKAKKDKEATLATPTKDTDDDDDDDKEEEEEEEIITPKEKKSAKKSKKAKKEKKDDADDENDVDETPTTPVSTAETPSSEKKKSSKKKKKKSKSSE